jgi:hypothetical protein
MLFISVVVFFVLLCKFPLIFGIIIDEANDLNPKQGFARFALIRFGG